MENFGLLEAMFILLFIGITLQWVGWRIKIPSIILLLVCGIILGPTFQLIPSTLFENENISELLKASLAIILFEGGLQLKIHELKESGGPIGRITSIGVFLNFILSTLAAHYLLELNWNISMLLSSILIVTGPTVILPMLRQSRIPRKLSSTLKWEGIIVDPFGALLTVLFFEYASFSDYNLGILHFCLGFAKSIGVSIFLAFLAGQIVAKIFTRSSFPSHLKVPFIFTLVFVIYYISNHIQEESGLFATTLFGIFLGNQKLHVLEELHKFKETLTVILISIIFITLSGTLDFEDLKQIISFKSIAFIVCIICICRPFAYHMALLKSELDFKERTFLAWIAPRGIVAAAVVQVFTPQLVDRGNFEASILVPITFAIILVTVIVHGLSLNWLAHKFNFGTLGKEGLLIVGANPWTHALAKSLKDINHPVIVADRSWNQLGQFKMEGIRIYFGEVLSDIGEESLDLTDISVVLAAGDNDSYNSLVCKHFSSKLGQEHVFQIALQNERKPFEKSIKQLLRGQVIISKDDDYDELERNHYNGWVFKKTKITQEFDYKSFMDSLPQSAKIILVIRNQKNILFKVDNSKLIIRKNDTVISYSRAS